MRSTEKMKVISTKDHVAHADGIIKSAMSHVLIHKALRELSHYDTYTFWHSISVARMSLILGMTLELPEDKLYLLAYSALLHDIGKVDVPKDIIRKKNTLTGIEAAALKKHPTLGVNWIKRNGGMPPEVLSAVEYHHENFDGSGYIGKKASEIGQIAQIIRICDTYDAMADDRPYRSGVAKRTIIATLVAGRGKEFRPDYVSVFLRIKDHGKIPNFEVRENIKEKRARMPLRVKLA